MDVTVDLTLVNLCAPTSLNKEAARSRFIIIDAPKRKNEYRSTFPAADILLSLAVSMCWALGSDTQSPHQSLGGQAR